MFTAAFGAALALLEYLLYFRGAPHYFEGDTIHWFYLRHRTLKDFALSFVRLDHEGWYRPLTDCTVQSVLYPFFGLEVAPYRLVQYLLFMAVVFTTYKLVLAITRTKTAAAVAAVFFGIHTTNAFVTYDVLFVPELVYSFFYIWAAIAYLRYRETERTRFLTLSAACFAASLLSKESAVTLPVTLVALDVLLNRTGLKAALTAIKAHAAILVLYLALVAGYLGVQRPAFRSIVKRPGPEIAYRFALDHTVIDNARLAATWAFNLPRGWQLESRQLSARSILVLRIFRLLVVLSAALLLLKREGRFVLAGFSWFLIAVAPGLPLYDHFLPYYLFLPVVGLSLIVGVAAEALYSRMPAAGKPLAAAVIATPMILVGIICARAAHDDAAANAVLGRSSKLAFNILTDLQKAHPTLDPNTTIYFSDAEYPDVSWDTAQGELFRMAYNEDTLHALYWGWGEVLTKGVIERGPVVVLKYHDFHVTDITRDFLAASEPPESYRAPAAHKIEITPPAATSGQAYQIFIAGLPNMEVTFHYSRDGGPVQAFKARLDESQRVSFQVSDTTPKGVYKIVGFRPTAWDHFEEAAASIRIN
jgi:hypothetical protein